MHFVIKNNNNQLNTTILFFKYKKDTLYQRVSLINYAITCDNKSKKLLFASKPIP